MNFFNFIKSQISILDIIKEYTSLKPIGIYWKGICPFHNEKTPSFTVSPHKQIFYCFGCHVNGDVIAFIAKIENSSQYEAAVILSERYSLKIPKDLVKDIVSNSDFNNEKDSYFKICQTMAKWCHFNLKNYKEITEYIKGRGINKESTEKFLIGFFPSGNQNIKSFLKFLSSEGFIAHDLIKFNILMEGKNNLFSPFEDRLIFPIKDQLSRFCGFGGRALKISDEKVKYYNSHENSYFNKGSLLYGLDLAKKSIQVKGFAFIVEGYIDCIAMHQHGYTNTVAILGTACTMEHLKILNKFTNKVYVLFDGDSAGQKAILRLTEMCWNVNIELKIIYLENMEDPASFLYKNKDLKEHINLAKDIYSYFIDNSSVDFYSKNLNEKILAIKKLTDIVHNIDDSLKRNILLQDISNKFNVPFETIKKSYNNFITEKIKQIKNEKNISPKDNDYNYKNVTEIEKRLFNILMNNFDLFIPEHYFICDFFNSLAKEILIILKDLKEKDNKFKIEFNELWDNLNDEQKDFLHRILLEYDYDLSSDFKNILFQFQKNNWKKIVYNTQLKLLNAKQNADQLTTNKIINEFQELKKKLLNGGINA